MFYEREHLKKRERKWFPPFSIHILNSFGLCTKLQIESQFPVLHAKSDFLWNCFSFSSCEEYQILEQLIAANSKRTCVCMQCSMCMFPFDFNNELNSLWQFEAKQGRRKKHPNEQTIAVFYMLFSCILIKSITYLLIIQRMFTFQ